MFCEVFLRYAFDFSIEAILFSTMILSGQCPSTYSAVPLSVRTLVVVRLVTLGMYNHVTGCHACLVCCDTYR